MSAETNPDEGMNLTLKVWRQKGAEDIGEMVSCTQPKI